MTQRSRCKAHLRSTGTVMKGVDGQDVYVSIDFAAVDFRRMGRWFVIETSGYCWTPVDLRDFADHLEALLTRAYPVDPDCYTPEAPR